MEEAAPDEIPTAEVNQTGSLEATSGSLKKRTDAANVAATCSNDIAHCSMHSQTLNS